MFLEAKGSGFDVKIIKKILAMRKKDAAEIAAEQALISVYMDALGMLADTPLGKAAIANAKPAKVERHIDLDDDDF